MKYYRIKGWVRSEFSTLENFKEILQKIWKVVVTLFLIDLAFGYTDLILAWLEIGIKFWHEIQSELR